MADELRYEYGQGAVVGSLAYDFNSPELFPEGETYRELPREETKPEIKTGVHTRARTAPRTKQGLSPFAILGSVAAAALLVTAISAQVGLVRVSGDSVALQEELTRLETTQKRLRIQYETAFNLSEVEEYATHTLGMRKPNANQVTYIDTSSPDRAVVVDRTADDSLVDRAADFLTGIGSIFE